MDCIFFTPRFNPLAGIRCFLTEVEDMDCIFFTPRFNPLAGIRCFLTPGASPRQPKRRQFQSPSGDSLFSDATGKRTN